MNAAAAPYSKTREGNGLIFTAGHIGRDDHGQIAEGILGQTEAALKNLEASLAEHGLCRSSVIRTTVYLADMKLWAEMNMPYREFFPDPLPARSAISVGLPEGVLIEIDAVAVHAHAVN